MVVITVEAYKNAKVHDINVNSKKLFWVNRCSRWIRYKNISDLVTKEKFGKYYDKEQSIKDLTKEQIRKFKNQKQN